MKHEPRSGFGAIQYVHSPAMERTLAPLTDAAVAFIGPDCSAWMVGTVPRQLGRSAQNGTGFAPKLARDIPAGAKIRVTLRDPSERERPVLAGLRPEEGRHHWQVATCSFENGFQDRLALFLPSCDKDGLSFALRTIWPVLRQDCLSEAQEACLGLSQDAMAWLVNRRLDLAVLVLGAGARLLRFNEAAGRLLDAGQYLVADSHGRVHSRMGDVSEFGSVVATLLEGQTDGSEKIVLLETADGTSQLPVTVTLFQSRPQAVPLAVVTAPNPPSRDRIERLAAAMGLTKSEARVAGLIQLGLTNRAAAAVSGLTEQTFATYVKRILAKMGMGSRAELVRLLTWQAAGGTLIEDVK